MGKDKAFALIDGVLQEYDICFNSLDSAYGVNEDEYKFLGYGIIDNISGVPDYSGNKKYFYSKIIIKKKRSSW